jgi:hypothetical protein
VAAFHIEQGYYGATDLSGRDVVGVGHTPEEMSKGNWTFGLIIDDRASSEQRQALATIFRGQAGGPMAALSPDIGTFAGIETRPIRFRHDGMRWSLSVPGLLDQVATGILGADERDPAYLDNVSHPANPRLALALATRNHVHAFGIDWDYDGAGNNGFFTPFRWQGDSAP